MEIRYEKINKGHNVYVNNKWVLWVYGSKKTANKEIIKYLNQ